ncbi:hypothetical protein MUG10_21380 [Xanthomonas prunicola]|uniref:Histidine kinase/HSP90-like ATPase domain-containing protein n=1 Tax=Xanthomonas prunicola TaxID=2053930 RepID=A0A9Q9J2T6_9XANT|nr:two-component regulator propeller domain-containing protein [Xanthomonas prunicola]USJ00437.1 hypothetical protein MUG10_21380 [Xanthomonas prunicola]UXA48988.1 hypothetical protein M0D44_22635 [Xanthomonas prunicola]UXA57292.1 hypothetical protein M0D47_21695 [Xanthomonas prunicola]UXA65455.1 hypothetical protein M0D43_21780 [Xanthomonas prunicola]
MHHTAWTARDGAPSQVWALAQTSDGYLWIGGATGLFRFDGVTFERYATVGGTQLPSTNVTALLATPEGGLWIGFRSGAVALLKDETLQVYSHEDERLPEIVLGFAQDHDGDIWIGTTRGLAVREDGRWKPVGAAQDFPEGERTRMLGVDRTGTLWASSVEKLLFLPRGEHVFRDTGQRLNDAVQIAQDVAGRHWIVETTRSVRPLAVARGGRVGEDEEIQMRVEGTPRPLDPLVHDEMFSIAREALINAFNHAQASTVTLELHYSAKALRLCISDDGRSIASEVLAAGVWRGHWGLAGMRERAARIGATLAFRNGVATGADVELQVPAKIAYRPAFTGWRRWFARVGRQR